METQKPSVSPLRQRMIEDMRMRKLGDRTQEGYVRAVRYFTKYLGRSPDTATVEALRNYQLYLVDHGTSPTSLNAAICGLKFFFNVTLDRPELMAKMQPVHLPRKLPVILSPDEVKRLIAAAGNLKHQTALALAYAAGLRVSEVVSLKVTDIDSQRMALGVEQGKGQKDRYAMLSPVLLERLRVWWRVARAQGKMLDGGRLFPGQNPVQHFSARQLDRAIDQVAGRNHQIGIERLYLRHDPAQLARADQRAEAHIGYMNDLQWAEGDRQLRGAQADPLHAHRTRRRPHCVVRVARVGAVHCSGVRCFPSCGPHGSVWYRSQPSVQQGSVTKPRYPPRCS